MDRVPCDVRRLILARAAADTPAPRRVCKAWRDDVDEAVVDARIHDLCAMLTACRIRTDQPPKRWRFLYVYGRRLSGAYQPYRLRPPFPSFPWGRAMAGPALAAATCGTLLLFF